MSLTQVMMGMGIGSIAMLASMQMMDLNNRSNRSTQLSGEFTSLSASVNQLLMTKEVCAKVFSNQSFQDLATPQNITLKSPDGSGNDYISTAKNPISSGLKVTQLSLKKVSGTAPKYLAQLDLKAEKQGTLVGSRLLSTTAMVNLEVDPATNQIIGCSGGGDYVQRAGDTMNGPLTLAAAPSGPMQAATKAYVDAAGGGGGGSCFETSAADCGTGYKTQVTQKRYNCASYTYTYHEGSYGRSETGTFGTFSDTLAPCPNIGATKAATEVTTRICCKDPGATP